MSFSSKTSSSEKLSPQNPYLKSTSYTRVFSTQLLLMASNLWFRNPTIFETPVTWGDFIFPTNQLVWFLNHQPVLTTSLPIPPTKDGDFDGRTVLPDLLVGSEKPKDPLRWDLGMRMKKTPFLKGYFLWHQLVDSKHETVWFISIPRDVVKV